MPKPTADEPKVFKAPLTRYTNYYVNATLASIGYYDPERRSWPIIKRMRKYPQIKFGLNLMKWAVLSTPRSIICDDPNVKDFLEANFVKPHLTRMLNVNLSALDFGFAPAEIRWMLDPTQAGISQVGAAVIKEIRDPDPEYCYPLIDEYGDYQGFEQWQSMGKRVEIPPDVSTWFTFLQEHGRWFGIPWTDSCYDDWYKAVLFVTFMAQEAERHGGPYTKVRYPVVGLETDPVNAAAANRAEQLGKDTRTNSYVALPSTVDPVTQKFKWDIERAVEHATGRDWIEKLNWLQTQMLRALGIPDLVATQTEIGARSLGETHKSMVYMNFDALNEKLDTFITEHVIKKLVSYNFTNEPAATLISEKLQDDRREFILAVYKEAISKIVGSNPKGPLARGIQKDLEKYGIVADEETPEEKAGAINPPPPGDEQPAGEGDQPEDAEGEPQK